MSQASLSPLWISTSLLNRLDKEDFKCCAKSDVKIFETELFSTYPLQEQQLMDQESPKVYLLWNRANLSKIQMYKGYTKNLRHRLREHNQWVGKGARFTSMLKASHLSSLLSPVCVVTGFLNHHQALAFEYRLKHFSWKVRNELNQLALETPQSEEHSFQKLDQAIKTYVASKKWPSALQDLFFTLTMFQFSHTSPPVDPSEQQLHVHWFESDLFWDKDRWTDLELCLPHVQHHRVARYVDEYICLQRSNEKRGCLTNEPKK